MYMCACALFIPQCAVIWHLANGVIHDHLFHNKKFYYSIFFFLSLSVMSLSGNKLRVAARLRYDLKEIWWNLIDEAHPVCADTDIQNAELLCLKKAINNKQRSKVTTDGRAIQPRRTNVLFIVIQLVLVEIYSLNFELFSYNTVH